MKKMSLMLAAGMLCLSGSALAGEKVATTEDCCRADDDGCTSAYVASCDASANIGYFCSTDKNDVDGDNSNKDKVVWQYVCDTAAGEVCTNTNGSIDCLTEECKPSCSADGRTGTYCSNGEVRTKNCEAGTVCNVSDTGWVDCRADDDEVPTGSCSADAADAAGCNTEKTIGWYCNNSGTYTAKVCSTGLECKVNESKSNSVECIDPNAPSGECDPSTVEGKCSSDGRTGYYCKNDGSGWNSKTCENNDCVVNTDRVNSVSCGEGSGSGSDSGNTGSECTSDEMGCTSASEGWYCSNGYKQTKTCTADQICGLKTYNGNERVACCVNDGQGTYVDAQYNSDVCHTLFDGSGSTTPGGDSGSTTCTESCSSEGSVAYNCVDGQKKEELCSPGTCQMNGTDAVCVAGSTGDSSGSGSSDKEEDSGCSATGAGFLLGWMGLAILPALRRRQK